MTRKMKSAPLYFTIGQVQHNPLLNLNSYVPAIQERMRRAGYPDFKRESLLQFDLAQMSSGGNPHAVPVPQEMERFQFSDASNTRGFLLHSNALSFMTTDYDTFGPFMAELKLGLEILCEAVGGLSFIERLGLRYLDALVPRESESIGLYIAPQLQGLPGSVQPLLPKAKFAYSFAESTLVDEEIGKIVARTMIQNGRLGFPPDLQPALLQINDRFRDVVGEHAILDTDGSFIQRQAFAISEVDSRMNQLHKLIDLVFRASVTSYAREMWGEEAEQ